MKNPILKAIIAGALNGIPLIKKKIQEIKAGDPVPSPSTRVFSWLSGKIAETLIIALMAMLLLWLMKSLGITIDDVMRLIGLLGSPSVPVTPVQ